MDTPYHKMNNHNIFTSYKKFNDYMLQNPNSHSSFKSNNNSLNFSFCNYLSSLKNFPSDLSLNKENIEGMPNQINRNNDSYKKIQKELQFSLTKNCNVKINNSSSNLNKSVRKLDVRKSKFKIKNLNFEINYDFIK